MRAAKLTGFQANFRGFSTYCQDIGTVLIDDAGTDGY